ncbi:TetR/AcrR family transcriptional regulator [Allonocardiopsis opalescens]|uniref:TetR family transcriptional regulator n=1 Tax=Allonocardiopsis opalescens TaxID=1144618 RepID=A0A2T0PX95_9ACTN|nr:TetR/AcrR family transcriptional regulator [Allonocardiopsis opalescens]PRX96058.1 TetR family transcriptional regulator [Allonocardiopsis opalescens]
MSTPRKRPRQQRSKETVAAILEAAAQLFGRHGYTATTTNRVAERAGVSIGSLYQYFPNKDALLTALAEEHLAEAVQVLDQALDACARERPDLPGLVSGLVGAVAELHTGRPRLHRLLFDQAPRVPELVARLRAIERRAAAGLAAELRRLGRGGDDPELAALLAVQGVEAQIHGAVVDPPPGRSAAACLAAVAALWTRALDVPAR